MGTKTFNNYEDLLTFTRASKGHALRPVSYGDELVDNGDFSDGTTGWTANRGSISESSGELVVTSNNADYGAAVQSINVKVGAVYYISVDVKSASATPDLWIGTTWSNGSILDASGMSANSTYTNSFIASASTIYITLRAVDAGTDTVNYDNISVKEVTFDQPDGTLTLFEHPDNIPRVEYDADRNRLGLLVEESRTNLFTYSEDFSQSAWNKVRADVTSNDIESPDKQTNGTKLTANATNTNGFYVNRSSTITAGATTTGSCYLKKGDQDYALIILYNGSNGVRQWFDISGGTVESSNTFGTGVSKDSASITDVGNGWFRCSLTADFSVANPTSAIINVYPSVPADEDFDATDGVTYGYLFGAQVEQASFPTSYIKTTGSTATRSADVATIPVADFGFNANAMTLFVEANNTDNCEVLTLIDDGSAANRIRIYESTTNVVGLATSGSTNVAVMVTSQSVVNDGLKAVIAAKKDDFVTVANAGSAVTDSAGNMPVGLTDLNVATPESGGATGAVHIKSIQYYPRRLTNAQLQALTEPRSTPTLSLTFDGLESSYTENYIHG